VKICSLKNIDHVLIVYPLLTRLVEVLSHVISTMHDEEWRSKRPKHADFRGLTQINDCKQSLWTLKIYQAKKRKD